MKHSAGLLLAAVIISSGLFGQTKRIAFESLGGTVEQYRINLDEHLFDKDETDFGLPPSGLIKTYKLDSVIFLSDSMAVIVTREYNRKISEPADSAKMVRRANDTIYNDKLYSRQHSLDSIKSVIKKDGYYINTKNMSRVVFIGYDNKKTVMPKKNNVPVILQFNDKGNDESPVDWKWLWMVVGIILVSCAGGLLSWKFYQPRLQKT